mmetsp:Transcript_72610/g.194043  ORF Transcript_72610/g.194043 Transcript_72610/m.194043 type:complete len:93 (-) Transcript_72610:587-865(-)
MIWKPLIGGKPTIWILRHRSNQTRALMDQDSLSSKALSPSLEKIFPRQFVFQCCIPNFICPLPQDLASTRRGVANPRERAAEMEGLLGQGNS